MGGLLRVLYVDTGVGYAGGQVALVEILKWLDRSRFEAIVAAPSDSHVRTRCAELGVPWLRLRSRSVYGRRRPGRLGVSGFPDLVGSLFAAASVVDAIRSEHIDIVHANTFKAALVAAPGCLLTGRPLIFHDRIHITHGVLSKFVALAAARIIVVSEAVGSKYKGTGIERKVRVVYDGIDTEQFAPPDAAPDSETVGFLGRISEEKGLLDLVECAGSVVAAVPGVRFAVGGAPFTEADRSYLERVKARLDELGLASRFEFLGRLDDVRALLSKIAVLALPSKNEPLGLVALEAMAMKKPVVSFDIGGPRETVMDGVDGLLVPPGDLDQFGSALVTLLEDRGLARRMGEKGRAKVLARFTSRIAVRNLEKIYFEICPKAATA